MRVRFEKLYGDTSEIRCNHHFQMTDSVRLAASSILRSVPGSALKTERIVFPSMSFLEDFQLASGRRVAQAHRKL